MNDATKIDQKWLSQHSKQKEPITIDAIFCDAGLSGLPEWRNINDNMVSTLGPNGRIVNLDWYLENPGFRGKFVKWIGKGEVDRLI